MYIFIERKKQRYTSMYMYIYISRERDREKVRPVLIHFSTCPRIPKQYQKDFPLKAFLPGPSLLELEVAPEAEPCEREGSI